MVEFIGSDVEIEQASDERECDYLISDEQVPGEPEVWEAWELVDGPGVIVIDDRAPEALAGEVVGEAIFGGSGTVEEVRWTHEVERTTVVDARVDYEVTTAYYSEEPPEDEAESIGHLEAEELLSNRGRDDVSMGALEDAWWFPVKGECGFVFEETDSAGETYNTYRTVRNLDEEELALIEGEIQSLEDDEDGEGLTFHEVADRINENAYLYERQSQYVAAIVEGETQFDEIRDRINGEYGEDLGYNDVSASYYKMMDRQEEVAWQIVHVWPHLPERHRSEEMDMILDALEVEGSPRDPEWLLDEE